MFGEFLHHRLIGNSSGGGLEHEAEVKVEGVAGVTLVLQANRVAKDLLAEHGTVGDRREEIRKIIGLFLF